jgi:hypothetical protein
MQIRNIKKITHKIFVSHAILISLNNSFWTFIYYKPSGHARGALKIRRCIYIMFVFQVRAESHFGNIRIAARRLPVARIGRAVGHGRVGREMAGDVAGKVIEGSNYISPASLCTLLTDED